MENNLTIMDLTILHGRYDIAQYIYSKLSNKELKTAEDYEKLAQNYFLRYVNYELIIDGVKNGKSMGEIGDFLTRPQVTNDGEEDDEVCCCCCPYSFFVWQPAYKKKSGKSVKENPEVEVETERKSMTKKQ